MSKVHRVVRGQRALVLLESWGQDELQGWGLNLVGRMRRRGADSRLNSIFESVDLICFEYTRAGHGGGVGIESLI